MFDSDPEKSSRSNLQVFLGFLLGIVASLGCLFVAIFFGGILLGRGREARVWIFPLIDAIALICVGVFPLRRARESSLAAGAMISLSMALLLDVGCAALYFSH